jgi:hypothetical protein
MYCGHVLVPTTQLPHDNLRSNAIHEDALVGEHETIKTTLQHDNFHEGLKINEEKDGSVNYLCTHAPSTQEERPTTSQGRYSLFEQKCPQLDEKPRKKKGSLTHLFIVTNSLQASWIHE